MITIEVELDKILGRFITWEKPYIPLDGVTKYGWKVIEPDGLELGDKTDIGFGTLLNCRDGVTIGDYVQIGPYCSILSMSTIPCKNMYGCVTIGSQTMVGAYSLVMPGVTIGNNCIISAYSYVGSDVPDNTYLGPHGVKGKVVYV